MTQEQLAQVNEGLDAIGIENVKNIVVIAHGATNGDVIKIILHPYKICEYEYSVHVYMTEEDFWKSNYIINCSMSWWKQPYTGDEECRFYLYKDQQHQ